MHHEKPQSNIDKSSLSVSPNQTDNPHKEHEIEPPGSTPHHTAANDHYIQDANLNFEFESSEPAHSGLVFKFLRTRNLFIAVSLAILAAVAAVIMLSGKNDPSISISDTDKIIRAPSVSGTYFELEQLGNRIILTDRWNATVMEKFSELWDKLDRDSQIVALQSVWFEQFTFRLARHANELLSAEVETDASISLARKLELKDLRTDRSAQRASIASIQESEDQAASETTLSAIVESASRSDDQKRKQPLLQSKITSDESLSYDSDQQEASRSIANGITVADADNILKQYSKSYIFGDVDAMESLFIIHEGSVEQAQVENTLKDYEKLLEASVQRWIEFRELTWKRDDQTAVGVGHIKTESTLRNNDRQITKANITVELRRDGNKTKIAKLDFSQQTHSIKQSLPRVAKKSKKTPVAASKQPSLVELKVAISRFVSAYESGDIENLEGLFSNNIISNKGTSKTEISDEYENLFSSSRKRQMIIQDLRWKFSKQSAKGVGIMKAVVVGQDNEIDVVKGKIQFVTKKINNQILITHLYQLEHSE